MSELPAVRRTTPDDSRTASRARRSTTIRRGTAAAAIGAAFVLVAACSSSGGGSGSSADTTAAAVDTSAASTAPSTDTSSSGGSDPIAAATAELAKYAAVPAFTAPGDAIDISALKGKTIYSIPQSDANPFVSQTDASEKTLAESYGIKFVEYSTQGTPAEWQRGINQAISAKAAAIIINALDPKLVAPQIASAKAAGIPVISAQFYDVDGLDKAQADLSAVRADNFGEAAKLEADYAIQATGGKADVVVVENTEQQSTLDMLDAMKAEFAAKCPDCKAKYINVPSADWATKIQTEVQSAIVADPGVNWVIPIYDPMTQFVVPAIKATGKTGSIFVSTFNGTPDGLKMVADNSIVKMDIGENLDWLASANLDEAFRTILGKPGLDDEKTALRVFTSDNVADTGNPPAFNKGFGDSYVAGYKTLWGAN
ncbi:MAG TPA: substrate-binding domain-containing protein [Jatrophihabitans sp.]|jgi:ribose transport system substrate-binding protein